MLWGGFAARNNVSINGDVSIDGDISIDEGISIDGYVSVDSLPAITGSVSIDGYVSVDSLLAITGSVSLSDGANLDSFSRLRVSGSKLQLSALFTDSKRPIYWSESATGGASAATFNGTSGFVELTLGTDSGEKIVRQTKEFFSYRAGQGQLIFNSFCMCSSKENLRQRVGYFFYNGTTYYDGLYIEQNGTEEPSVNIMSSTTGGPASPTINSVAQSSWNLDKMDGTGRSGITLDLTKRQILVIDFQWLGVGRVRFGFDDGGIILYFHEFNHSNLTGSVPYMKTGKLPVRYEIENTGETASSSTLIQICSAVIREGADDEVAINRTIMSSVASPYSATTTLTTVLGLRLKSAHIRQTIRLLDSSIVNIGSETIVWMLMINPGGTGGATWTDIPGLDSIGQISRSNIAVSISSTGQAVGLPNGTNSAVYSIGFVTDSGKSNAGSTTTALKITDTLALAASIAGVSDELWVVARTVANTSAIISTLTYIEIR